MAHGTTLGHHNACQPMHRAPPTWTVAESVERRGKPAHQIAEELAIVRFKTHGRASAFQAARHAVMSWLAVVSVSMRVPTREFVATIQRR
mmetsp:Transcript_110599/g.219914  ORF Transcript_110599/g.219914 Transcript_110599/m.219914 type:complete len:90 (+) Transcript_110599:466-735(+)